jgi:hypothetical protein
MSNGYAKKPEKLPTAEVALEATEAPTSRQSSPVRIPASLRPDPPKISIPISQSELDYNKVSVNT